jgi:hypothetical protein
MKKLLIVLLGLSLVAVSNAQIKFGLRAGLNSHYVNEATLTYNDVTISNVKGANVGFHGGVMLQISFLGVFLQPELLISSVGNEVKVEDLIGGDVNFAEQSFTKLDIPVLVGKRFGPARVGVGPVATIMLNSTSELADYGDFGEKFNSATFGFQAGVGLDIAKAIAIDLKYEGSLSKLSPGITVGGQERPFDSRASQLILSVGFLF